MTTESGAPLPAGDEPVASRRDVVAAAVTVAAAAAGATAAVDSAQAQAKADAMRNQAHELAAKQDYMKGVDMSADAYVHSPQAPGTSAPAARCTNCGVSVGSAKFCPDCGQPVKSGPKFCPNCGTMSDGAKFCPDCGHKIE